MKLKKLLATTLALALALSPVNVFASEVSSNSATSEGTISGNIDYLDTVVYKVALPTTDGLRFIMDPQGLASATTVGVSLNNLSGAGKITSTAVISASNKSSVPIVLSCKMYLTDKTGTKAPAGIEFISENSVSESQNEAKLTICPSESSNAIPVSINSGKWVPDSAKPVYATTQATANEFRFALGAADYVVKLNGDGTKTYAPNTVSGATLSGNTAFCISGNIAKNADWTSLSNETDPVRLNTVFSFDGLKSLPAGNSYVSGTKMISANTVLNKISSTTEAYGYFTAKNDVVWLALDSNGGITDASKFSDLKVNGNAVTRSSLASGWVSVSWANIATAGCAWDAHGTYTFTFTYDGVNYSIAVQPV